jgi:hypothetical protein
MTDIVLFAGPVMVKDAFKRIDWQGRDVRIVPIVGSGSTFFSQLAEQLRDRDGRILPGLMKKYAPGVEPEKIALAAYSAGHGLLNKIADVDDDRARVNAMILSDATFSGFNDAPKRGYVKFGIDAARGQRLLVSTTANTTDGTHRSGRDSWLLVLDEVARFTGRRPAEVAPQGGVRPASGGWWRLGSDLYWGNYSASGAAAGAGSDISHGDHHDLGAAVWQAYLAPYLAGGFPWGWAAAGVGIAALTYFLLV